MFERVSAIPASTEKALNIDIPYDPQTYGELWVVYMHSAKFLDPSTNENVERIMYVGYCRLNEVFLCPDARKNKAWLEHMSKLKKIKIHLIATYEKSHEAYNMRGKIAQTQAAYCNIHGYMINNRSRIRCNETGEEFESASDACKKLGIAQSAMSNHLNKRVGYNSVHTMTFDRI